MESCRHRRDGGCLTSIIIIILVAAALLFAIQRNVLDIRSIAYTARSFYTESTIVRNKLDNNTSYINDCVIDELGWFDNVAKTESRLKEFWEKTGVQPYILLRDYDASLKTEAAKEQWALDYYDANFDTENIFLFVYFAEKDTDNDVGYMSYANGYQTTSVMDAQAVDIFWNNIDRYWYTDLSTDDVIVNTFHDTAKTIMHAPVSRKIS